MTIKSEIFDDVYFSADGGLAETRHVFLCGNNLPQAWEGIDKFTIAETGFGTGLNFLAVWKLFEETAKSNQRLDFISVEKYPLSRDQIAQTLAIWQDDLGDRLARFLSLYPIRIPGPHKIHLTDRVNLTVWFGDIADVMPEWQTPVDAWFLDGFTPAKNPDMWNDALYSHMARLSHAQTTYATFTAAGDVRRGLAASGFSVEKIKGFGRKRDMIKGQFMGEGTRALKNKPHSIAIIGGGLAGCALGYYAKKAGLTSTIYEAGESLASGASGGKLGMMNPKLTAKPSPQSDYYASSYAYALRVLSGFEGIDFNIHGSLHLCTDADKDRRFTGYIENLGWSADHIYRHGDDLYYPDGASVSPLKLCAALAEGVKIRVNHPITTLDQCSEDIVILANGFAANELMQDDLLQSVRGQVSWVKPQSDVDKNICFGGYITPQTPEGFHVLGASFQPWNISTDIYMEDHDENIARYNHVMGASLSREDIVGGWSALRTSSKDRFPIVGHWHDNVYLSTAHGSHGIISSLMAAEIIISQIQGAPVPASQSVLKSLNLKRFHKH